MTNLVDTIFMLVCHWGVISRFMKAGNWQDDEASIVGDAYLLNWILVIMQTLLTHKSQVFAIVLMLFTNWFKTYQQFHTHQCHNISIVKYAAGILMDSVFSIMENHCRIVGTSAIARKCTMLTILIINR